MIEVAPASDGIARPRRGRTIEVASADRLDRRGRLHCAPAGGVGYNLVGRVWGSGAPPIIDPATLALTLWLQGGNYDGPPTGAWHGTPSAGTSGANDVNAVRPTNDGLLDGHTIVNFLGSNNQRFNGAVASTYAAVAGTSAWALVRVASELGDSASGQSNGPVFTDLDQKFGIGTRMTGPTFQAFGFDASYHQADVTFTNAIWQFVQWRHDGVTLGVRLNNGAWSNVACGPLKAPLNSILVIGIQYNVGLAYDGDMIDIGMAQSAFTDATFDGIYGFMKSRYPSAGLP